jgi:hypothetical protein
MRLHDVFGARACAADFVGTMGVGCPGLLVVTGVLLIVSVLDSAFLVWLLYADLSYGKKGERLRQALVRPDARTLKVRPIRRNQVTQSSAHCKFVELAAAMVPVGVMLSVQRSRYSYNMYYTFPALGGIRRSQGPRHLCRDNAPRVK